MTKSNKILIALQFWQGDKDAALRLARFLADIEPKHSDLADFILVKRFDCKTPLKDQEIVPALSRKFNLYAYTSPRRETGWPMGCNGLWLATMEWARSMMEARRVPNYKAIFCCESDGCPLFSDWVERMSAAWDNANRDKPVVQAGPMVGVPALHINGNCLMSGDLKFLKWVTQRAVIPPGAGWDFCLAPLFKEKGWANIHQMRSYYAWPTVTPEQYAKMVEEQLIWVHGPKDDSMIRMGRKRLI
jgi:hypothetical protein